MAQRLRAAGWLAGAPWRPAAGPSRGRGTALWTRVIIARAPVARARVESASDDPPPSTLVALTLTPPVLLPGQVLAARFRLRRFIAHGGMGEVWEAEDLEFAGEPVAVKTLRSEIARDDWALARFRREIQLARKVTHPNVCRVFDLFHHRSAVDESGTATPILLLAMELLLGETLAERLRRGEPLGLEQALPIARQIAAGLAAGHDGRGG